VSVVKFLLEGVREDDNCKLKRKILKMDNKKKCMTTLLLFISLSIFGQRAEKTNGNSDISKPSDVVFNSSDEEKTRKFTEDYISHINRKDWITGIEQYLPHDNEAFLKEHTAFRKSFPNYEATIKRMLVEGSEVVLWLNITANYVENYRYKNSNYSDQLLWDYEAKNQALDWDETWYFNVTDGKFGDKWDSLKDNFAVMKGLSKKG